MKSILNVLLDIALIFWTLFYFLLLYFYFFGLVEKIKAPTFKNLSWDSYWILGFVFLLFFVLNVFLIKWRIKRLRKNY